MPLEDEISEFIRDNFGYKFPGRALEPDLELFEEDVIDSLGVMEIVMFLEDRFAFEIDDDEIVPENFGSVRAMARFVSMRQASLAEEEQARKERRLLE